MTLARRAAADLIKMAMCIGAFIVFLAVFGITVGILSFVLGSFADGFRLDPKGFLGGLLHYMIPSLAGLSLGLRVVERLDPLWARLERWKTQETQER